jgi:hypothetical protein
MRYFGEDDKAKPVYKSIDTTSRAWVGRRAHTLIFYQVVLCKSWQSIEEVICNV